MTSTPHINEVALSALAYGQPLWAPEEAEPAFTPATGEPSRRPRGNGTVHQGDLDRGQAQMERVLGW